jgi:hypothetical protein|tara:strand:+ start:54 stop:1070 length:1017 start_codon:yes stop_codon:yes gene_type:complete
MKYNDIKLAEKVSRADYSKGPFFTEPADQSIVRKWCDGIRVSFIRDSDFKTTKYSKRTIAAARKFAKANPKFSKSIEACIASSGAVGSGGTVGNSNGNDVAVGNSNGNGGNDVAVGNSNGNNISVGTDNGVAQGVDITGTTPMQKAADQLEGLLNAEDWAGAKALLDSNSDLKALFPPEYQDMIDAAIQADIDAIETKEKADAQAAIQKQAKEDAKIAAEQAAAEAAEAAAIAAAEIAAERKRLADLATKKAAEAERLKKLEDEKAAAKAKADEAAKIAAAEKAEAEKLEAAKIAAEEAEAERQRIADEEAEKEEERNKTAPGDNLEEPDKVYDWDDL